MEDDEIIINIDRNSKKDTTKNKSKNSVKNKSNSRNTKNSDKIRSSSLKNKKNYKNTKTSKKNQKIRTVGDAKENKRDIPIKLIAIILLFICLIIFLFSSRLFNIKNIYVLGNEKLSENKIISLSSLELETNIFRFNKINIKDKIKENAYVEKVEITRKLPSTVQINIEERTATYMLQFADSYVYINNQGYMLDISNEKLNIPILVGFTTDLSNIKPGNRLNTQDLEKMKVVIEIYEMAKTNQLNELISRIDISNTKNYTIFMEKEGKTVYLGDGSELNPRMLCLKSLLEVNKGVNGEVFLNVDLNSERVYFRKSTN